MIIRPFQLAVILSVVFITGCQTANQSKTEVKEIAPGLLQGYLSKDEIPNSLTLVPPPPEEGTPGYALDQDFASKAVASRTTDTTRLSLATRDAYLYFPEAASSFQSTVGVEISETKTPHLYMLMRRVLTDAALSTSAAKHHYKRKRPFMVNNTPTCTPADEEVLRKDGSYPSGHTAIGWAWSLVFTELFPAKTNDILKRGYEFGESRVICNVHWHSDVEAGRVVGAATVARLHANKDFQRDMEAVRKEIVKINSEHAAGQ
ncbi:phosphatase PAP2 family protein [Chryseolinea sp. T2]|uniref:acid phosphatase n=1 Tax=Chryseolinea sp. T2 TaxID=3129255 RepID=UPI0030787C2B